MTATVETVAEQLDLAAIMPTEKVVSAVARSVTLTETDTGKLFFVPHQLPKIIRMVCFVLSFSDSSSGKAPTCECKN